MKITARRQAFTMIEVMVTLAIAVLISGLVYQIMTGSSKINKKVEGKTEAIQSANLALECIKRDLRQLVTRPFIVTPAGTYTGVVGDAQHPVLVSADGTQMSFHIPDPSSATPDPTNGKFKLGTVFYGIYKVAVKDGGIDTNVYHLVRAEGSNPDMMNEASGLAGQGKANVGAIFLMEGKDAAGNPVAPIQFKLIGPNPNLGPGSPIEASTDNNYYVQVKLAGADSMAQENQSRTDLTMLGEPSRLANVPGMRANEYTLFNPPVAPLFIANAPPQPAGLPVNLPNNPNPANPNGPPPVAGGPGDPPTPGDPSQTPPGPVAQVPPGATPPGGTPPGGTPPGGTPPGGTPPGGTPPGGTPPGNNVPPGVDPNGQKAFNSFIQFGANGKQQFRVDVVLKFNGQLVLTKTDANGVSTATNVTPQGEGLAATKAAMDDWGKANGIDMTKVKDDPNIVPPADYTNQP